MRKTSSPNGRPTAGVGLLLACLAVSCSIDAHADVYNEARPIVEVRNGKLQGVEEHGILAFKNIPYAAPPVGELRWRPSQPAQNWQGVRDASRFGQACPQPMVEGLNAELIPGSEDCLKLNVYTPKSGNNSPVKNLPVMVWIHGGALLTGSATEPYYEPIALIGQNVIVATIDYRLGKLGFFAPKALAEEAAKNDEPVGNYGIMDQIAALKWIRENIAAFGGDPNNVTIFGESAGGRSVTWLMTFASRQRIVSTGQSRKARNKLRCAVRLKKDMASRRRKSWTKTISRPLACKICANCERSLPVNSC